MDTYNLVLFSDIINMKHHRFAREFRPQAFHTFMVQFVAGNLDPPESMGFFQANHYSFEVDGQAFVESGVEKFIFPGSS